MKIITKNPVFESGETKSPSEMYYSNFGPLKGFDANKLVSDAKKYEGEQESKGMFFDKVKGIWTKAQESGLLDKAKDFIKGRGKSKSTPRPSSRPTTPSKGGSKKGMSTTTKVLIGVGVVAIVGLVIYKMRGKK